MRSSAVTVIMCVLAVVARGGDVSLRAVEIGDFASTTVIGHAPGDDSRLFVGERDGLIRIVRGGAVLPTPFLDIGSRVTVDAERGLQGMAFHPEYAQNGRFYLYFSNASGISQLSEFTVSADPDVADTSSERNILRIPVGSGLHDSGWLQFGPDGLLYVARGDDLVAENAQNTDNIFGSILRIDVDADDFPADPDRNYAIPADNPFVMGGGAPEIWIYGLRNPWRCDIDPATGHLYVADVGSAADEEVNFLPDRGMGGENLGWVCFEGPRCTDLCETPCEELGAVEPIYSYSHADGCAIVGGVVYRGSAIPELQGAYLFGDYCARWVRLLRVIDDELSDVQEDVVDLDIGIGLLTFGRDGEGEVYVGADDGVFKIVPDCTGDEACDTDIAPEPVGDCVVNNLDLGAVLAAYLASAGDPAFNAAADFNNDDVVDNIDLGALLADYLNQCD